MAAVFEIDRGEDDQFGFQLSSPNGERMLESRRYTRREEALQGIESVRRNAPHFKCYEVCTSFGGESYFFLKSSSGEILGRSPTFDSPSQCQTLLEIVAADAGKADVSEAESSRSVVV